MKLAYFPDQTALGSSNIWQSFLESSKKFNFSPVENSLSADAAVIWSVLWKGRLLKNQKIYEHYRSNNKPIFIIEVGSLHRGKTWKICLNHTTSQGIYGNNINLDHNRAKKLDLRLLNVEKNKSEILIALQHYHSLQWQGQPAVDLWLRNTIDQIKRYSDRPIIVRPHPRSPFSASSKHFSIEQPSKLPGTYDVYDINYNYHCVINHNSGTSIQSAISGTPTICDTSSLAYPVSMDFSKLESPVIPEREEWFTKICHTEWTVEEIAQGVPLKRLLSFINR
jgi:hypothetical protein